MFKNIARIGFGLLQHSESKMSSKILQNLNSSQKNIIPQQMAALVPIRSKHQNHQNQVRNYGKPTKREKTLDYSSSDKEFEILGHKGESIFWRQKIRTFHAILDVNKDGVISFHDFQLLADRFIDLGHLSDKHTLEFRNSIQTLWETLWGEITPYNVVTVERYLEDMHHVLNDKSRVVKVHAFLPYLFKAVDKDKSGEISIDEFKLFFSCLGHEDEHAKVAFLSIDSNNDGKITIHEFVSHGKDFFLTEDEERVSKHFWGPLVDH